MSESTSVLPPLGCVICRAVPASRGDIRLNHVRSLHCGPHEGYALYACSVCRQMFLEQFQEITWLPSGEDDIWQRWVPITPEELAEIDRLFPSETEDDALTPSLARLMHARGRLVRDPTGLFSWSESPHDAGNLFPPG